MLYARALLSSTAGHAAEDVVQGVFLRLLQGLAATPANPRAYLYAAVRNAAINELRGGRRTAPLETVAAESGLWFRRRVAGRDDSLALQHALRDLPEEQREVVVLRVWCGMTLEEVASATAAPLNTVASRYRYALDKLHERLQPRGSQARTTNG